MEGAGARGGGAGKSEPAAAVGDPPGKQTDGEGGAEGPPEGQEEVGEEAEGGEK